MNAPVAFLTPNHRRKSPMGDREKVSKLIILKKPGDFSPYF